MRSTECDPLSIRTPPPLTAGSEFHLEDMSTRAVNAFSNRMISPRMPDVTMLLARITSST